MPERAVVSVVIADDEPVARAGLRALLASHEWLTVAGDASHGAAALSAIDVLKPDVVFLDIEMPGMTGLEVMRRMQHQPVIVFTTAWSQHATDAFELGALDYLLKPFGADRLTRALDRVRAALGESDSRSGVERLRELQQSGPISRIFVRNGRAIVPVSVSEIAWIEADGDYAALHVGRARHLVHVPLSRLETRLDAARFVRIHRTTIVNLEQVSAFKTIAGGRFVAELKDGTRLDVSRSKARELRALGE
jgi:two-component system LytT family response regulator